MKFCFIVMGIGLLLGATLGVQDSFAEQLIKANSTSLTYSIYQNPAVAGIITNDYGDPLSQVYVYSYFSSGKAEDLTDGNGKFFLRSSEKYPPGEYSIEVYARSESSLSRNVVSFEVLEPKAPETKTTPHLTQAKRGLSIAEMMEKARSYNSEKPQTTIKTLEKNTTSLEPQRILAQDSLTSDIRENSREELQEKNKNSFANFVKTLDLLMHGIFWDQFDFTQKISDEAYEAKTSALKEGKTSLEATKVYQETAAVPQNDVIDYIEEINIKHGFANATVQEQFDENGKVNRTQIKDQ
ncbi:MAG: carboxypeptidase-like regulatory domain-containing protein [Nitrosopumilus sp.]|nr:carboxypeptidase-like regulatory domain-containing protein [Nitrosopumilus sp.]MDH3825586.1 carboxypeptidase-like regulatory domain-containing protein [Nitrosopumilus sp.]